MDEKRELGQAFEARELLRTTLVMATMVLLGLLATLVVTQIASRLRTTACSEASADIRALHGAVEQYAMDHGGRFPSSLEDLWTPNDRGRAYLALDTAPIDPWGRPYQYTPPSPGSNRFRVFTLGADGLTGGEGEDRDIDYDLIAAGGI